MPVLLDGLGLTLYDHNSASIASLCRIAALKEVHPDDITCKAPLLLNYSTIDLADHQFEPSLAGKLTRV